MLNLLNERSKKLFTDAKRVIPGGVNSPVRAFKSVGGDPVLSKTLNLRTMESEIAKSLTDVQNQNKEVEIGSYPFFRAGPVFLHPFQEVRGLVSRFLLLSLKSSLELLGKG